MKIIYFPILVALAALCGCATKPLTVDEKIANLHERFATAYYGNKPEDVAQLLPELNAYCAGEEKLNTYGDKTLSDLFYSAAVANALNPDDAAVAQRCETIYRALNRRGKDTPRELRLTGNALANAGLVERYALLVSTHPYEGMPSVPLFESGGEHKPALPYVYRVMPGGDRLVETALSISSGPHIVMTTTPGYELVSDRVASGLAKSPYRQIMRDNMDVVIRQFDPRGADLLRSPLGTDRIYLAEKSADFPGMKFDDQCMTYFLLDGKIILQKSGWPGNPDVAAMLLRDGLRSIALLPPAPKLPQQETEAAALAIQADNASHSHDAALRARLNAELAEKYIAPQALASYNDETIERILYSLWLETFYNKDKPSYVLTEGAVFDEKARRGHAVAEDVESMAEAYLENWLFDKAADLKRRFPKADFTVPQIAPSGVSTSCANCKWRAFKILDGGKKLKLVALPLDKGPQLVIAVLPGCHFVGQFVKLAQSQPRMMDFIRKHAILLSREYRPDDIAKAAAQLGIPAYQAYSMADFPGIKLESSPEFYFLKDGKQAHYEGGMASDDKDTVADFMKGMDKLEGK
jgi:hypothetical protein